MERSWQNKLSGDAAHELIVKMYAIYAIELVP